MNSVPDRAHNPARVVFKPDTRLSQYEDQGHLVHNQPRYAGTRADGTPAGRHTDFFPEAPGSNVDLSRPTSGPATADPKGGMITTLIHYPGGGVNHVMHGADEQHIGVNEAAKSIAAGGNGGKSAGIGGYTQTQGNKVIASGLISHTPSGNQRTIIVDHNGAQELTNAQKERISNGGPVKGRY